MPEITWANTPSFEVSEPHRAGECDDCNLFVSLCYAHAIDVCEDRVGHRVRVDEDKCIGCGLFVEYCPECVFRFADRRKYFDPVMLRVVERNTFE